MKRNRSGSANLHLTPMGFPALEQKSSRAKSRATEADGISINQLGDR